MKINGNFDLPEIKRTIGQTQKTAEGFDFKKMLVEEVNKINDAEQESTRLDKALITGEVENIHEAMIAAQKAELTLNYAVQVKSKAVEAYKEILRLQL